MDQSKAYNPPLLFLAGLLTFCLGVIAAVFSAIDKVGAAHGPLLGPVLAWAAVTALVGTFAVGTLQYARSQTGTTNKPSRELLFAAIFIPVLFGVGLTAACLRLGIAISGKEGVWTALTGVFGF